MLKYYKYMKVKIFMNWLSYFGLEILIFLGIDTMVKLKKIVFLIIKIFLFNLVLTAL